MSLIVSDWIAAVTPNRRSAKLIFLCPCIEKNKNHRQIEVVRDIFESSLGGPQCHKKVGHDRRVKQLLIGRFFFFLFDKYFHSMEKSKKKIKKLNIVLIAYTLLVTCRRRVIFQQEIVNSYSKLCVSIVYMYLYWRKKKTCLFDTAGYFIALTLGPPSKQTICVFNSNGNVICILHTV